MESTPVNSATKWLEVDDPESTWSGLPGLVVPIPQFPFACITKGVKLSKAEPLKFLVPNL